LKKYTEPLACGVFYHIYNRGINREDIFKEERNYAFFLRKYAQYVLPVAETYAYCLLRNHFHLLVRTRSAEEVIRNVCATSQIVEAVHPADNTDAMAVKHISNQFAKLFNSYAQAINKAYHRTGGLFENVFRRIPVNDELYFAHLVYYIHFNPQRHGLVPDFKDYPHSSYRTLLTYWQSKAEKDEQLIHCSASLSDAERIDHHDYRTRANLHMFEIELD
jgi:REP element-mobilizing transposase RayT